MSHKTSLPIIRNYVLIALPIFALYLLNRKYYENSDKQLRACFTFSLISVILYQAAMISSQTYRISLYLHIFWPLFIAKYIAKTKSAKTRFLYICLVMILSVLFWYIFLWNQGMVWDYTLCYEVAILTDRCYRHSVSVTVQHFVLGKGLWKLLLYFTRRRLWKISRWVYLFRHIIIRII